MHSSARLGNARPVVVHAGRICFGTLEPDRRGLPGRPGRGIAKQSTEAGLSPWRHAAVGLDREVEFEAGASQQFGVTTTE